MTHTARHPSTTRSVALAVGAAGLWGLALVLVKLGLRDVPPLTLAAARYVLGALTLLSFRALRRRDVAVLGGVIRNKSVIALGALLYAAVPAAQFVAIDRIEAGTFNFVFQAGIPLILAFTAGFVLHEHTTLREWLGVAFVVAGVYAFYPSAPSGPELAGALLAVAAAAGIGASNLIQRRVMQTPGTSSLDVTFVSMAIGAVLLTLFAFVVEGTPRLSASMVALVVFLGVVTTALAFTMWHEAMRGLKALHAGIIASGQIFEVPILAVVILGESFTYRQWLGSAIVLVGILVVQTSRHLQNPTAPLTTRVGRVPAR
ncbi:MAG TPA: DMT family transporter [Actinobacteria bacterium]|nr:DMT family transporter [Actinomycetota bacterium]